jgi:hypothetical protein
MRSMVLAGTTADPADVVGLLLLPARPGEALDRLAADRLTELLGASVPAPRTALPIPAALAVGAEYGLIVLAPERPEAWRLAAFILSGEGQAILARHGFTAPLLPREAEG